MDQERYAQLEALLRLFHERGLHELIVADGSLKLHLRRPDLPPVPARFPGARPVTPPRRVVQPARRSRTVAVRSPLIGLFYRSAAPDAPPFVEVGDVVEEGQTVCIIEAMKVFNEINAEWSGRVVAIPAEDGKLVQAGEPLVVLEFQLE